MRDPFIAAETARRGAHGILLGTIAEVDLAAGTARVEFEDDWISDALPWLERRAGALRTWSAPTVGEQVLVIAPTGEPSAGVILAGLPSDAHPRPSDSETLTLAEWDDEAQLGYDTETHEAFVQLPEDGKLKVTIGSTAIEVSAEKISLKVGSAEVLIEDGEITLKADKVNHGDKGGQPVARNTDPVVANKVVATTTKVRAV